MNSFTSFTKLPLEVRQMIWNLTIPQDRVVTISNTLSATQNPRRRSKSLDFHMKQDIPAVLRTCHESRQEALGKYTLLRDSRFKNPVFFNSARDILLFSGPDGVKALSQLCCCPFSTDVFCQSTSDWKWSPDFWRENVRYLALQGGVLSNSAINSIRDFAVVDKIIFGTDNLEEQDQLRTIQKLNWAVNYARKQERAFEEKYKEPIFEIMSEHFRYLMRVSRVIRKELDEQDYENTPISIEVLFLTGEEFGRHFGLE